MSFERDHTLSKFKTTQLLARILRQILCAAADICLAISGFEDALCSGDLYVQDQAGPLGATEKLVLEILS